jgi:hypothetical protein
MPNDTLEQKIDARIEERLARFDFNDKYYFDRDIHLARGRKLIINGGEVVTFYSIAYDDTTTAQEITNNTETTLETNTKISDEHDLWDGDTFTAPSKGLFVISLGLVLDDNSSNDMFLDIRKNGSNLIEYDPLRTTFDNRAFDLTDAVYLAKGDTLTFVFLQDSGISKFVDRFKLAIFKV